MCEADEINTEDLETAAEYFGQLTSGSLPQQEACRIAQEQFGISIQGTVLLDRILMSYATTLASIESCVLGTLKKTGYQPLGIFLPHLGENILPDGAWFLSGGFLFHPACRDFLDSLPDWWGI
ncbi:hypothetical protein [Methylobacter sp. BBA5.1]|jgi:hypothetical protein|uniref:hypothetical protein n=1 Tax=Methylobacter sp. BBA5.1 TaxID=1495064 RepID=UPI00055B39CA|nr:hypothetical protein [Methylobacter sp. BBA5.1]